MSLAIPTVVVTSTDTQVQQMWELANEEGESLAKDFDWQILRKQQTFSTVNAAEQINWLATDIDHFVFDTAWNRTTVRPALGPLTPQQWQAIQAAPQLVGVFLGWIQRGGQILVTPTPPAGQTVAYEYISNAWALSAAAVPQSNFLADTDTAIISERLIRLGLRWRFLSAKGLDYAEAMQTYELEKQKVKSRDGGNTTIDTTGWDGYVVGANIPQGNFPG